MAQVSRAYAQLSNPTNYANAVATPSFDLAEVPRIAARELTREAFISQELAEANLFGASEAKIARLTVELAAVQRHTADLLASVTLPPIPKALADVIAARASSDDRRERSSVSTTTRN